MGIIARYQERNDVGCGELGDLKRKPEGKMRTRVTTYKVFKGCGR